VKIKECGIIIFVKRRCFQARGLQFMADGND